uniref:Uncharacterized protein n=1 Tax=Trichobilharzia regenti TaxID=157069 RepID=A0AA85K3Q3_TRIRE|nr:unnamed protein product [Trichobilharzia regenti]
MSPSHQRLTLRFPLGSHSSNCLSRDVIRRSPQCMTIQSQFPPTYLLGKWLLIGWFPESLVSNSFWSAGWLAIWSSLWSQRSQLLIKVWNVLEVLFLTREPSF